MKKCFVISPIGLEGSLLREHADDVFDYIIKPAIEECGMGVYRSDHISETGKISDQMLRGILEEDLCVAVLTGYNPNVFYELAIAHAFQRPTLLMIEKGQPIPFDIKDVRCVEYDLKPRSLFDKVYAKEIVNYIKELGRNGWKAQSYFGGLGIPLNRIHEFSEKACIHGKEDYWMNLIENTKQKLDLIGVNLKSWKKRRGFRDLLNRMAEGGCKIRILLMHEDNPQFNVLADETSPETDYENIVHEIKSMVQYFTDVPNRHINLEVRQMKKGCLHLQMTITDEYIVCIQYLFSQTPSNSPLLQWSKSSQENMYQVMTQEFETLWNLNG